MQALLTRSARVAEPETTARRAKTGNGPGAAHNPSWHRLALGIQPKLEVGTPGDAYEQEADRVAERIMRMPEPAAAGDNGPRLGTEPAIQRVCGHCRDELQRQPLEEKEEETLQRQPIEEEEEGTIQRQPLAEAWPSSATRAGSRPSS